MVYKKYIKRGNKVYGPYSYKSIKKDGKVITEYIGKSEKKQKISSKKYLLLGMFFLVAAFSILFVFEFNLTGKVILNIESSYKEGEFIDGILQFSLGEDELIPASTNVLISLDNFSYEYPLGDLVSEDIVEGILYIEDSNVSEVGDGYGLAPLEESLVVFFTLEIYSEETEEVVDVPEEILGEPPEEIINETIEEPISNETEEVQEELVENETTEEELEEEVEEVIEEETTEEEVTEETIEEVVEEEVIEEETIEEETTEEVEEEETEEPESEPEKTISITGAVIKGQDSLSNGTIIQGEVSINEPFTYNLEKGQMARIVSSSQDINLEIKNKKITVTTDYEGEKAENLQINLTKLSIPAKEGLLTVSLVYNGTELVSASRAIVIEESVEEVNETNITIIDQTNITSLTISLNRNTYYQNETINIFGEILINGEKVDKEVIIEIESNGSNVFISNTSSVNGSYSYSLLADFENDGSYYVNVFSGNLSNQASFYFISGVFELGNYMCKEFKEQVLWSSGYSLLENGSTNYQTWYLEFNCANVNQSNCFMGNIDIKTRFVYTDLDEEGIAEEGYVQISEPDESICDNPEQGSYSKYIAYEELTGEDVKLDLHCGDNKNQDSRCGVEISDFYNSVNCFGVKTHGAQYLLVDVFEVEYDLCWDSSEINSGGEDEN